MSNGATPIELAHGERGWTLELHELVRVDYGVYRPRRFRIRGEHAIVAYLRQHHADRVLAGVTARLIRRYARTECAFAALNGAWLARASDGSGATGTARPVRQLLAHGESATQK